MGGCHVSLFTESRLMWHFILMRNFIYISLLLLLHLGACHSSDKGTPLARVGDEVLYEKDLEGLLPDNISPQDSLVWVRNYVNSWINTKLIINKAKENLKPEQLNFKSQLEKYKNSLITYAYQTEVIKQNLDTAVSNEEIENYYLKHKNDFVLLKNIVRVMYVVINNDKKLSEQFSEYFHLPDSVMLDSLEYNSRMFAQDYFLDTTQWIPFDELLKNIPLEVYNKKLFLENNKFVKIKDKQHVFYVKFVDFKIKDDLSPLALEKENIRMILINKRKMELIREMREKLYRNALNKNEIEIYYTYD